MARKVKVISSVYDPDWSRAERVREVRGGPGEYPAEYLVRASIYDTDYSGVVRIANSTDMDYMSAKPVMFVSSL